MTVIEKLKEMVEEPRQDLGEVKGQVRQLLPVKRAESELPVRYEASNHPIAALQRETNRLFDDFLRGSGRPFPWSLVSARVRLIGVPWRRTPGSRSKHRLPGDVDQRRGSATVRR